jgi:hypothetical protein
MSVAQSGRPIRDPTPVRRSGRFGPTNTLDHSCVRGARPLASAERDQALQRHVVGLTVVRMGTTRFVLAGSVRLEEAAGRTRAVWKRGVARSPERRSVGLVLRRAGPWRPSELDGRPERALGQPGASTAALNSKGPCLRSGELLALRERGPSLGPIDVKLALRE